MFLKIYAVVLFFIIDFSLSSDTGEIKTKRKSEKNEKKNLLKKIETLITISTEGNFIEFIKGGIGNIKKIFTISNESKRNEDDAIFQEKVNKIKEDSIKFLRNNGKNIESQYYEKMKKMAEIYLSYLENKQISQINEKDFESDMIRDIEGFRTRSTVSFSLNRIMFSHEDLININKYTVTPTNSESCFFDSSKITKNDENVLEYALKLINTSLENFLLPGYRYNFHVEILFCFKIFHGNESLYKNQVNLQKAKMIYEYVAARINKDEKNRIVLYVEDLYLKESLGNILYKSPGFDEEIFLSVPRNGYHDVYSIPVDYDFYSRYLSMFGVQSYIKEHEKFGIPFFNLCFVEIKEALDRNNNLSLFLEHLLSTENRIYDELKCNILTYFYKHNKLETTRKFEKVYRFFKDNKSICGENNDMMLRIIRDDVNEAELQDIIKKEYFHDCIQAWFKKFIENEKHDESFIKKCILLYVLKMHDLFLINLKYYIYCAIRSTEIQDFDVIYSEYVNLMLEKDMHKLIFMRTKKVNNLEMLKNTKEKRKRGKKFAIGQQ